MSSIVVVTVTKIQSSGATVAPTATAHSTPPTSSQSASSHSGLSSGAIAGIVIGILVGGFLLIVLVFYLLKRYSRRNPTRAPSSAYDHDPTARDSDNPYLELPSTRSSRFDQASRLSLQASFSSEPFLSAKRFPRSSLSPTLRVPSPPNTHHSISFDANARCPPRDLGEIPYPIRSDSVSHLEGTALSNAPPVRSKEQPSLNSQRSMFLHRMLQSRARTSEVLPLEHRSSVSSRSTTLNSSTGQPDEERLLANAECAALQDADAEMRNPEEVNDEPADDSVSLYSQLSADLDHVTYFSEHQNGSTTPRRISSRKRPRTPAAAELPPVPEVPDIPSAPVGQSVSRVASSTSLHGQMSHGRASPPVTSAPEPLRLLTSVNFGNGGTAFGTPPGSMSSNTGSGLNSSGKASRYPSLAASSIGNSSRPGPRPDDGTTDWRHPPTGLAGLKTLQVGPMHNPHSPVDEHLEVPLAPSAPVPKKRAHLREGTTSSVPEVERRDVTQGGIASIEVAL